MNVLANKPSFFQDFFSTTATSTLKIQEIICTTLDDQKSFDVAMLCPH